MKKVLAGVILTVAVASAHANNQIKITWPFGPVSATQAMRATAEQANQDQKEYVFLMDFKTGGGGAVAVNAVASDKDQSILAHSGAFFINPLLSDTPSYNINDWRMIDYLCDLPFTVASKRFKNFGDIPKSEIISVGHNGVGTTTHLIAEAMRKKYPNMNLVPYKSAAQAVTDLLGGHVDIIVSLPGDTFVQHKAGTLTVLAVSGPNRVENVSTLSSFGISANDYVTGYFYFVPKSAKADRVRQWQTILQKAKTNEVKAIMERNYCRPSLVSPADYDSKFVQLRDFWSKEVESVKK